MSNKAITLSSAGLKNIVLDNTGIFDEFRFIFGQKEIKMKNIFAEFISPRVSILHQSDPTISSLNVLYDSSTKISKNSNDLDAIITDDVIRYISELSTGQRIEIKQEDINNLKIISIFLSNDELYFKLNDFSSKEKTDENIDYFIEYLKYSEYFMQATNFMNSASLIDFISSHFYCIDQNKILTLPNSIFYSIISNEQLTIESEDSLFEIIEKKFQTDEEGEYDIVSFYEQINFEGLSENKFKEFIEKFDAERMSNRLWTKLCRCFYLNYSKSKAETPDRCIKRQKDSHVERYEYNSDQNNSFSGIIHHLTEKCGGNVCEKGVVNVTASSISCSYYPKLAVDLEYKENFFATNDRPNSWLKYDFKELKVKPTSYTIRSRYDCGKGDHHPKSWVIEGSNTDRDEDWKILDTRKDVPYLNDKNAVHTFNIEAAKESKESNESYRYLRIRQTDKNFNNNDYLVLSALEYFGFVYNQDEK